MAQIEVSRINDDYRAIGAACRLLSAVQPYRDFLYGPLVETITGQVGRRHYLFAHRGADLIGYVGWALCDDAVAARWVAAQSVPDFKDCLNGPAFVLVTFSAASPEATRAMIRACRNLYPNKRAYFRRAYSDGRAPRASDVANFTPNGASQN